MSQALMLMDIQNTLLDRFGAGDEYLDRVAETQVKAEQAGLLVVLVRMGFAPGHPEVSTRNRSLMPFLGSQEFVLGEPGTEIHPRLVRGNGEVSVIKKRVGAFYGTELEVLLRSRGVTGLALAGIATRGVVLSTVREAADRDFDITVLEDLCLDADPEVHRVLTEKVFPRQAEVKRAADWSCRELGIADQPR